MRTAGLVHGGLYRALLAALVLSAPGIVAAGTDGRTESDAATEAMIAKITTEADPAYLYEY